jgi:ABC-type glycerol-3-phosphate transport system permease component
MHPRALRRPLLGGRAYHKLNRIAGVVLLYASVTLIIAFVALPLVWMTASSFKPQTEQYIAPPSFFPKTWSLQGYLRLFQETRFALFFKNSLVVASGTTLLSMIVASLGGYALSRFRYAGFALFARATLLAYMVPSIMLVIPLFVVLVELGLANTLQSLIITNTTFTLPFALWLMRAYFGNIPVDLDESAMIDGCTRFQALLKIVMPLAAPGIIATSIFAFTNSWNEFLYASALIQSDALRTLPPGMGQLIQSDNIYDWGMLMASAVLMTIPALIFYVLVQRNLIVDLSAGAVKQ